MNMLARIGSGTISKTRFYTHVAGILCGVAALSVQPRYWPRTVRDVLARQVLFTGLEAVRFISLIAVMVGISIVVQAQLWLTKVGQSELLGPLLVAVIIRELGPLLTAFVVIGRSGSAIATELGNMKVRGEIDVLDAQGLDPFTYLVLPRVVGLMLSIFCLTIVFIVVSFISGFVSGIFMGANTGAPALFFDSVMRALSPADMFNLLAKTIIPGMLTGAICCAEGLAVKGVITEVPQATTRALVLSVAALFVSSAIVSLLTYL